jgi:hypothetical protein
VLSDARLYGDEEGDVVWMDGVDERWQERRRGDSDLDWGTEDEDDGKEMHSSNHQPSDIPTTTSPTNAIQKPLSEKAKGKQKAKDEEPNIDIDIEQIEKDEHGMEVDADLDVDAMKAFVSGLIGNKAGEHVSMDDVMDERKLRMEDEEFVRGVGGAVGSSDDDDDDDDEEEEEEDKVGDGEDDDDDEEEEEEELDEVLRLEEKLILGESDDDDEDDDDDDEVDMTPRSGFKARLEKLREKARSQKPRDAEPDEGEDEDEDMVTKNMAWADEVDDDEDDEEYAEFDELIDQIGVRSLLVRTIISTCSCPGINRISRTCSKAEIGKRGGNCSEQYRTGTSKSIGRISSTLVRLFPPSPTHTSKLTNR